MMINKEVMARISWNHQDDRARQVKSSQDNLHTDNQSINDYRAKVHPTIILYLNHFYNVILFLSCLSG
jgi:adenylate kinase family enzyme